GDPLHLRGHGLPPCGERRTCPSLEVLVRAQRCDHVEQGRGLGDVDLDERLQQIDALGQVTWHLGLREHRDERGGGDPERGDVAVAQRGTQEGDQRVVRGRVRGGRVLPGAASRSLVL